MKFTPVLKITVAFLYSLDSPEYIMKIKKFGLGLCKAPHMYLLHQDPAVSYCNYLSTFLDSLSPECVFLNVVASSLNQCIW